jgi:mRNA interferase YafQ
LQGLYACSCGYDCRIIFSLEEDLSTEDDVILLLDVGSHEEVY